MPALPAMPADDWSPALLPPPLGGLALLLLAIGGCLGLFLRIVWRELISNPGTDPGTVTSDGNPDQKEEPMASATKAAGEPMVGSNGAAVNGTTGTTVNGPAIGPADEVKRFDTGAVRSKDAESTRFDLISPIALEALAATYAEGSAKYGDANWERGMPVHDLLNHAIRHIYIYLSGDRSEPHLPHAAWGIMAAIHSDKLWPHLNAGHLRGPGCTLTPAILARLEEFRRGSPAPPAARAQVEANAAAAVADRPDAAIGRLMRGYIADLYAGNIAAGHRKFNEAVKLAGTQQGLDGDGVARRVAAEARSPDPTPPLSRSPEIKPGDHVRVIRNKVAAHVPNDEWDEELKPGDVILVDEVKESKLTYRMNSHDPRQWNRLGVDDVESAPGAPLTYEVHRQIEAIQANPYRSTPGKFGGNDLYSWATGIPNVLDSPASDREAEASFSRESEHSDPQSQVSRASSQESGPESLVPDGPAESRAESPSSPPLCLNCSWPMSSWRTTGGRRFVCVHCSADGMEIDERPSSDGDGVVMEELALLNVHGSPDGGGLSVGDGLEFPHPDRADAAYRPPTVVPDGLFRMILESSRPTPQPGDIIYHHDGQPCVVVRVRYTCPGLHDLDVRASPIGNRRPDFIFGKSVPAGPMAQIHPEAGAGSVGSGGRGISTGDLDHILFGADLSHLIAGSPPDPATMPSLPPGGPTPDLSCMPSPGKTAVAYFRSATPDGPHPESIAFARPFLTLAVEVARAMGMTPVDLFTAVEECQKQIHYRRTRAAMPANGPALHELGGYAGRLMLHLEALADARGLDAEGEASKCLAEMARPLAAGARNQEGHSHA